MSASACWRQPKPGSQIDADISVPKCRNCISEAARCVRDNLRCRQHLGEDYFASPRIRKYGVIIRSIKGMGRSVVMRGTGPANPKSAKRNSRLVKAVAAYWSSSSEVGTNSKPWGPFKLLTNGFAFPVWMSTNVSWFRLPTEAKSASTGM